MIEFHGRQGGIGTVVWQNPAALPVSAGPPHSRVHAGRRTPRHRRASALGRAGHEGHAGTPAADRRPEQRCLADAGRRRTAIATAQPRIEIRRSAAYDAFF
ncbi:mobilization protein (plasmid) [Ralstonia solanacearum]|nr:mobilization protein [Ralstonia solanacearum]